MPIPKPSAPLQILATLLFVACMLAPAPVVIGAQEDEERRKAFQLYKDAKYIEALPPSKSSPATSWK